MFSLILCLGVAQSLLSHDQKILKKDRKKLQKKQKGQKSQKLENAKRREQNLRPCKGILQLSYKTLIKCQKYQIMEPIGQ